MIPINPIEMEIDGIRIRSPKIQGMNRKPEKIWSKNTGRTGTARMQGTIIAIKQRISISWTDIPYGEAEHILELVNNPDRPFHILKWTLPTGQYRKMECYFGTPSVDEYTIRRGQWCVSNFKVDAIER